MPGGTIDGSSTAVFGGEARKFRVRLGELRKIEQDCDAGPGEIARRLARGVLVLEQRGKATAVALLAAGLGEWRVNDVRQVILHGLMGAGMLPQEAVPLISAWVDERGFVGLLENLPVALTVITGAISGPEGEPVGEPEGATAEPKPVRRPSRTAARAGRPSTATRR